jgi:hypothetical protein
MGEAITQFCDVGWVGGKQKHRAHGYEWIKTIEERSGGLAAGPPSESLVKGRSWRRPGDMVR